MNNWNAIVQKEINFQLSRNKRYVKLKKLQDKIQKEIENIEKSIKVSVNVL